MRSTSSNPRSCASVSAHRFGDIEWSDLIRTGDGIIHHYEAMNRPLIAEIIADELPPLMPRLREIRDIVRTEFDAGGA